MSIFATSSNGMIRVEWTNLGEGRDGDYDPTDPEDINLLRYDAYVRVTGTDADDRRGLERGVSEEWGYKADASYCTRTPASTDDATLRVLAEMIAQELSYDLDNGNWKRTAAALSFITPNWRGNAVA